MTVWGQKSGELAAATGRDFERLALPLLRAFWPDLIQPRELRELDRAGIDLVAWSDTGHFSIVVQCKGLYAQESLVSAQMPQIRSSVASFRASGFTCHTYLLVHNRTGEDQAATQEIEILLKDLVSDGLAIEADVWDRQVFLSKCKERLKREIAVRVAGKAKALIDQAKRFFVFGDIFVDPVPVSTERWWFKADRTITRELEDTVARSPMQVFDRAVRTKWTLLIGHFGQGKSTFALHAAATVSARLVYVHSSDLPGKFGSFGTNHLMQEILRSNPLFDEFDDATASEYNRLGGTLLRKLLSNPDEQFALVIDGLDESTRYSSGQGLIHLSNELEDLRCPVVLVTRKEHFESTLGNFKEALWRLAPDEVSVKGGSKRQAQICCLEQWSEREAANFLDACSQRADQTARRHLQQLLSEINARAFEHSLGELLRHPLFLHMMASVASEGQSIPQHPASLVEAWIRLKIRRDVSADRPLPWPLRDIDAFVGEMLEVMEDVAIELVQIIDGAPTLLDDMSEQDLLKVLARRGYLEVDPSALVGASLLVPAGPRQGKTFKVKFYHRALHEYLLAQRWQTALPAFAPPRQVLYWMHSRTVADVG